MRNVLLLLLLTSFTAKSFASEAQIKVIYGEDDRKDLYDGIDEERLNLAKSTAAMIPNGRVVSLNNEEVKLVGESLESTGVCSHERFAAQPTAANCSGFLVGKNKLVTAGHCVTSESSCKSSSWVFDYKVDFEDQAEVIVNKKSVYKCSKIISRELNNSTDNDYALIELDREVLDRDVLKVRKSGTPKVSDKIFVIGHPSGLPTKLTDNGVIRSVNDVFFVTNLDTYGGNSGSAVFNATSKLIEGILVRGETDYNYDRTLNCRVSNRVLSNEGRGEDVTLIKMVKGVLDLEEQVDEVVVVPAPEPTPVPTPAPKPPREETWWDRFLAWLRNR